MDPAPLVEFFRQQGLVTFTEVFVNGGYDLETFAALDGGDLDALQITKPGHRKKLLLKAELLKKPGYSISFITGLSFGTG
jgi:hypothetical protein